MAAGEASDDRGGDAGGACDEGGTLGSDVFDASSASGSGEGELSISSTAVASLDSCRAYDLR
jgi:hypothetical protein